MIIDVNKLKQQGKTEEEFSFVHTADRQLTDLPRADITGGIKVRGKVKISGRKALVEGVVNYVIEGECSKCLSPARAEISEDFSAEYGTPPDGEFPIKSGLIDLTAPVEEAVIISSPMIICCKPDCKGVCPVCGANLNYGVCKCKTI